MSERRQLISPVQYHSDDDTGMYKVGEIDTCPPKLQIEAYIKSYGDYGKEQLLDYFSCCIAMTIEAHKKVHEDERDCDCSSKQPRDV